MSISVQIVNAVRAMSIADRTAILGTIANDLLDDTNPHGHVAENGMVLRLPWATQNPPMLLLFAVGDVATILQTDWDQLRAGFEVPREVTIDIPKPPLPPHRRF